jgi:hypothetical protein
MNAAFTSYEGIDGPGSAVTGGHKRLCDTTGTAARRARPFTIQTSQAPLHWNRMNGISTLYRWYI